MRTLSFVALCFALWLQPGTPVRAAWVNETNLPAEADYASLFSPLTWTTTNLTTFIYGRVYEQGVTESAGPGQGLLAELGYGPFGTNPLSDNNWNWLPADYSFELEGYEHYNVAFPLPGANGIYSYTFRFSFDGGGTYTAGDTDGAGAGPGLEFDPSKLGKLTIVPEPATGALLGVIAIGTCGRRRSRSNGR
jgi:hypothetical protein